MSHGSTGKGFGNLMTMKSSRHGCLNSNWKGGRKENRGYIYILIGNHPRADKGYVAEHILVVEKALGRYVSEPTQIHHANEDKGDNSNKNLVVCENWSYHKLLHQRMRAYKESGDANNLKCCHCKKYDQVANLLVYPRGHYVHRECKRKYERERLQKIRTALSLRHGTTTKDGAL